MRTSRLVVAAAILAWAWLDVEAAAAPAPAIDNDRVTVWDITLAKGEAPPAIPTDKDT